MINVHLILTQSSPHPTPSPSSLHSNPPTRYLLCTVHTTYQSRYKIHILVSPARPARLAAAMISQFQILMLGGRDCWIMLIISTSLMMIFSNILVLLFQNLMLFWYLALPISFLYIFEIFKKRRIRLSAAGYILEHTRNLLLKFPRYFKIIFI